MTDDVRGGDPAGQPDPAITPPAATPELPAPPTVEWLAPSTSRAVAAEPPRTFVQRVAEGVVWALGIFAVLFLGRIMLLFNASADLSGFERGEIVGRIAGALFIGAAIRWLWVKLRKRGRVLSPWILVIAAVALASSLTRAAAVSLPPAGQPLDTYLQVGAEYTLAAAPADVAAQVLVGTGPEFAATVWKEPPYAVVVYALDVESGKLLAASVMGANR